MPLALWSAPVLWRSFRFVFAPLLEKEKLQNEPNLEIAQAIINQQQMQKFEKWLQKNEPNFR